MAAKAKVGKAKALTAGTQRAKALATKMKAQRGLAKKAGKSRASPGKKGGKGKGKKGKGRKRKRKKKGPRCPIKRRKKALKRKCYSMTDMRALLNTYYTMHGVVEMLKFRKFKWKKKKKPT